MTDASVVFVTRMTGAPPGSVVYHLPRGWGEWTRCGRHICDPAQNYRSLMIHVRRDVAEHIGYLCGICRKGAR